MTTHTRTYINQDGLPVLERLIREGLVLFEAPARHLHALFQFRRGYIFCRGPLPAGEIGRSIHEAEYLIFTQGIENNWRKAEGGIFNIERYLQTERTKAREKADRLSDVRCLMAALMHAPLDEVSIKQVAALLGQSFMLDGDFESAHCWMKMAE